MIGPHGAEFQKGLLECQGAGLLISTPIRAFRSAAAREPQAAKQPLNLQS
jgi:hypothetical protein